MQRLVALTIATITGGVGIGGLPAPAAADTPNCVSHREHDRLRHGMPKWRVHRITDTRGVFWDGHAGGYTRRYRACWRSDKHLYLTYYAPRRPHVLGEMGMFRP